ncbi:MAG TPA: metallophosphoesterase family protein [Vicinamibacterales bacterium]|jgi:putative phosphoesterase|nr:metallophosphoesterase family protein [Vicinamibacterales bacterium]
MRIGLIADTHGLVRPEVVEALAGVERILHAGDVGGRPVLKKLEVIAPIQAVFGNVDLPGDPWLEQAVHVTAEGRTIHVSHGHELGRPTPDRLLARYDAEVLVYGHTHQALIERAGTRLVVNPGAAGPRRFNVRPSVAILEVTTTTLDAQIVWL